MPCSFPLSSNGPPSIEFSGAGHLPIIHVATDGTVREYTTPQTAVGMFEDQQFTSARLSCVPGDLLAVITDGLTEVFDRPATSSAWSSSRPSSSDTAQNRSNN